MHRVVMAPVRGENTVLLALCSWIIQPAIFQTLFRNSLKSIMEMFIKALPRGTNSPDPIPTEQLWDVVGSSSQYSQDLKVLVIISWCQIHKEGSCRVHVSTDQHCFAIDAKDQQNIIQVVWIGSSIYALIMMHYAIICND